MEKDYHIFILYCLLYYTPHYLSYHSYVKIRCPTTQTLLSYKDLDVKRWFTI